MRVVLLTMDSPLSDAAVIDFLADPGVAYVVAVVRANPWRGGSWRASGWRLLPYLLGGYAVPAFWARLTQGGRIARAARARGIDCVRAGSVASLLRAARPDLLVCLHCNLILDAATLGLARHGGINLHPSLLPRHRGPMPVFWALQEPGAQTGVTVHRMIPRIDAGAILAQRRATLAPGLSVAAATRALHRAGVPLMRDAIASLAAGRPEPPPPAPLPYRPFPSPAALRGFAKTGGRLFGWGDLRA